MRDHSQGWGKDHEGSIPDDFVLESEHTLQVLCES
jgi:hypothetical protein